MRFAQRHVQSRSREREAYKRQLVCIDGKKNLEGLSLETLVYVKGQLILDYSSLTRHK